jgi:hypothetical protein
MPRPQPTKSTPGEAPPTVTPATIAWLNEKYGPKGPCRTCHWGTPEEHKWNCAKTEAAFMAVSGEGCGDWEREPGSDDQ